ISASPLFDDNGEYNGSIAVFTDHTKQKTIERRLRNARDRASLYLDLMGHDIRNHLQEIQVSAELLEFYRQDSFDNELLKNIFHAVSKSAKIISETKSVDQMAELPLSARLLDEVLREIVKASTMLLEDVEISLLIHVTKARIMADDSLDLLLSNLIANAYENNKSHEKRIWIELLEGRRSYELLISDNGQGIPDSAKSNILDPQYRIGGVGLHLVYHIIEKYSGVIEVLDRVQDVPGQGTKMRIMFPKLA
ncbi:MAG: ATP-binding protein, partial [Candidatus Thorarchaeota archaeon]